MLLGHLAAPAAPAQDEGQAVAEFMRVFRSQRDGAVVSLELTGARRDALFAMIEHHESARTAAALAHGFAVVDAEIAGVEVLRLGLHAELDKLLAGQLGAADPVLTDPQFERRDLLELRGRELRRCSDDLRHLRGQLVRAITELREPGALRWLLQKCVRDPKRPLALRVVAGGALGGGDEDLLGDVAKALPRAREPAAALALVDALMLAGTRARPFAAPLIGVLRHPHPAVRERAAQALARVAVVEAVGPMVALLESHTGQSRLRIVTALEVLTGQRHGTNFLAWQGWWDEDGAAFTADPPALGTFEPRHFEDGGGSSYYFGLPQEHCSAIVYCIDCSGSMIEPVPTGGLTATPGNVPQESRLEACKRELIQALAALRPDQRFAILWYHDRPHPWREQPLPATPDAVAAAQEFVRTLQPGRTTNIHDTLRQAFALAAGDAREPLLGAAVDTVFLLTDGTPTHADGEVDRAERILDAVRGWNPLGRVTVHTIGIGDGLDEPFLEELAAQNGGRFVRLGTAASGR